MSGKYLFWLLAKVINGYALGYFLIAQEMKWGIFSIGAGLITCGIILNFRRLSRTVKAVNSYNSNLGLTSMNHKPFELSLGLNENGLGLNFNLFPVQIH
ncbi:MAG: hypothetical protein ACI8ZM_005689 [Crocinitomix sp.]|jgi:hypothetical protein